MSKWAYYNEVLGRSELLQGYKLNVTVKSEGG